MNSGLDAVIIIDRNAGQGSGRTISSQQSSMTTSQGSNYDEVVVTSSSSSRREIEETWVFLLRQDEEKLQSLRMFMEEWQLDNNPNLMQGLAYLCADSAHRQNQASPAFSLALSSLAYFLANPAVPYPGKRAGLKLLMQWASPPEVSWQRKDPVLTDTLEFLSNPHFIWEYPEHSEMAFLLELRELVLNETERLLNQEQQRQQIRLGAHVASHSIYSGATWIESRLSRTTSQVTAALEAAGEGIKTHLKPQEEPILDEDAAGAALAYTGAARRATDSTRDAARRALEGFRDVSTKGLSSAAEKVQQNNLVEKWIPDEGSRTVLGAVGQVGLATLGAAAIMTEAVFESTKAVAQTAASVTADVVHHKYGQAAGEVARDAAHTVGNVLRTVAYVAMFEVTVLTTYVAKEAGKAHMQQQQPPAGAADDSLMLSEVDTEARR